MFESIGRFKKHNKKKHNKSGFDDDVFSHDEEEIDTPA